MLLIPALSGCLVDGTEPAVASPDTPGETRIPWALTECTSLVAAIPVDAEAIRSRLPDGFRPWTPEEAGLPPQPTADALLTLEVWVCGQGSGLEGERIEEMVFAAVETPTDPPEALRSSPEAYTPFSWQMLIPDPPRRERLQAAGVPAFDGSADLSGYTSSPAGATFRASWTIGEDRYVFTGTTNEPRDRGTVVEREFTAADGGFATWAFVVEDDLVRTGAGTIEMSSGSLAAEIVGAERTQAFLLTGHPSFEDGAITLPRQGAQEP